MFVVELQKSVPNESYGFGVVVGRNIKTGIGTLYIARIIAGGLVERDGRLRKGDKVIKVY